MEKNLKFSFDKNINSFSPEGRLYQVEYSIKAAEISGATCIAIKGFDTICVVEDKKRNSGDETLINDSISFKISNNTACVCSGIPGDLNFFKSEIIEEFCKFYQRNGFEISVDQLANALSMKNQALTQQAFTRIPAVKTILFGIDKEIGPLLLKIDPSGYFSYHSSCAIGEKANEFIGYIQKNNISTEIKYFSREKTIINTISFLEHVLKTDLKAIEMQISVVSVGNKIQVLTLTEIDNYLEKLKKINQIIEIQE